MKTEGIIPALGYDFLTPLYDPVVAFTTRERTFKAALVEQVALKPEHHVLDLACGTGTLTLMLKDSAPEADVTGVDGDPLILQLARRKALNEHPDVQFEEGMSFALPYPDEAFDRVVSSLFFHHLISDDKLKTFHEIIRVLKPGGEFHIADWGRASNLLTAIASYSIRMLDGFEPTADNFKGALPALMAESGLARIEETVFFDTVFGTIRLYKSISL